jgi:hypothetical protein
MTGMHLLMARVFYVNVIHWHSYVLWASCIRSTNQRGHCVSVFAIPSDNECSMWLIMYIMQ